MTPIHKQTLKNFEGLGGRFLGFWLAADNSTLTVAISNENFLPGESPGYITRILFDNKGEQITASDYPAILKPNPLT